MKSIKIIGKVLRSDASSATRLLFEVAPLVYALTKATCRATNRSNISSRKPTVHASFDCSLPIRIVQHVRGDPSPWLLVAHSLNLTPIHSNLLIARISLVTVASISFTNSSLFAFKCWTHLTKAFCLGYPLSSLIHLSIGFPLIHESASYSRI